MTTQTPDAVREAEETVRDALMDSQYLAGVTAGWNAAQADNPEAALAALRKSREGHLAGYAEAKAILAALDSRAGDAGEGLSDDAPTPADALAMIEQEISFWPEGSRAQAAATRCRNIVRAMVRALSATPAPAVDAVPAGEVER